MNFNLEAMRSFITTTQLCHGSTKTYNMLMTKDGCVSRKFNLQRQVGLDLVSSLANMSLLVQNLSLVIQSFFFFFCQDITHTMLFIFYLLTQITGLCFWEPGKYDFHFQSEKWKNIPK